MSPRTGRSQGGYTLVELIIATSILLIVMSGLTYIVLTAMRAANTATSRVEASSQLLNFERRAMDDFSRSSLPSCPCTSQIHLVGTQVSNGVNPQPATYTVDYTWDGSNILSRSVNGGAGVNLSTNVTGFSWNVDGSAVVVTMTVTVSSYSESQTMRFYPEVAP